MVALRLLCIFCIIVLAGCQTASGDWCDIAKPLRLSPATVDAMTDAEVAAMLAHNKKLERLCGVKP